MSDLAEFGAGKGCFRVGDRPRSTRQSNQPPRRLSSTPARDHGGLPTRRPRPSPQHPTLHPRLLPPGGMPTRPVAYLRYWDGGNSTARVAGRRRWPETAHLDSGAPVIQGGLPTPTNERCDLWPRRHSDRHDRAVLPGSCPPSSDGRSFTSATTATSGVDGAHRTPDLYISHLHADHLDEPWLAGASIATPCSPTRELSTPDPWVRVRRHPLHNGRPGALAAARPASPSMSSQAMTGGGHWSSATGWWLVLDSHRRPRSLHALPRGPLVAWIPAAPSGTVVYNFFLSAYRELVDAKVAFFCLLLRRGARRPSSGAQRRPRSRTVPLQRRRRQL